MSYYRVKKVRELRQMSSEELREMLRDIGATQQILGAQKAAVHAVNPGQWRNIKKTKARILTILGERSRMENGKQKGGFRKRGGI